MTTDQKILEKSILSHTDEAVRIIENFDEQEIATFFESISVDLVLLLIDKMSRFKASRTLIAIMPEMATVIIEKLPISLSKTLLSQLDESPRNKLLDLLSPKTSNTLRSILLYSKNTVGAYMQPLVFTLQGNHTAGQALEKIKKNKGLLFQQVYVLDQNKRLSGVIELQQLLSVNENVSIKSILNTNPTTISASMDISALKESELWDHSFSSLPVVDIDGVFLGIITKKTLSDLIPEKKESIQSTRQTGAALGDLYRLGISSFLHGAKVLNDK